MMDWQDIKETLLTAFVGGCAVALALGIPALAIFCAWRAVFS